MARYHDGTPYPEREEFLGRALSGITDLLGEGEEELESAYEGEEEEEYELEAEDELEGRYEGEFEEELEALLEQEMETEDEVEGEEFLGGLVRAASGLLGEGEEETEFESEWETEGEEFFGKIGGFLRKAAPLLKTIAKTAGPLIATAVGGPAAGLAARAITSQLEGELEDEGEYEAAHRESVGRSLTSGQAAAEMMAAQATVAASEAEAEALVGAAAVRALSPRDRAALESLVPVMVRGAAVLTRLLHGSRGTRPFIRVVPTVVDNTACTLLRQARQGRSVTPVTVARTMATHASRVLGSPRHTRQALVRNRRGIRSTRRYGGARIRHSYSPHPAVTRGVPVRTRTYPSSDGRYASRRGITTMRVVTPVRVPGTGGRPSRLVRVVTDVRVPRGAVPARRTAAIVRGPSVGRRF
ncbi:hypothetical protein [Streptomyces sp. NPDC001401]|uniref:hypothetical protein n=1 Tax=Streptomyces sp. NPDC001401 TaxID=3364570 RepID=UPI003680D95F